LACRTEDKGHATIDEDCSPAEGVEHLALKLLLSTHRHKENATTGSLDGRGEMVKKEKKPSLVDKQPPQWITLTACSTMSLKLTEAGADSAFCMVADCCLQGNRREKKKKEEKQAVSSLDISSRTYASSLCNLR